MMLFNGPDAVRQDFAYRLDNGIFTSVAREASMTSLVGKRTIEIVGASFVANQESLFGTLDTGYLKREEEWYDSMSLKVDDIPGGAPAVWKAVAGKTTGEVNSNYGYLCYHKDNGAQFDKVVAELKKNPESRRAVLIYTRQSIWEEYNRDGMSDFICTNAVQYLVRDGAVHAQVQMRSNDAVFGYKNDRFWQQTMLERVAGKLELPMGNLHWNAGSLHVYERHFYLVDHYSKTGEISITKSKYRELYPTSPYGGAEG
jgi:thymidylate synthase